MDEKYIERLEKKIENLLDEKKMLIKKLTSANHRIEMLEARLEDYGLIRFWNDPANPVGGYDPRVMNNDT